MTGFDAASAAAWLMTERRARRTLAAMPPGLAPRDHAEGVAAQRALARAMGVAVPAGFKIGATAGVMQDYLGLAGPLAGFMPEAGLHGSGSTLAYAGFVRPGVECEIAVSLGRDLPGECSLEEAGAAVDGVMAAIEIVEQRYPELRSFGAAGLVADQVFHAGAVLGEPVADWRGLDLHGLAGCIRVDGADCGGGAGRDLLGGPVEALAWLAGSSEAAAFGGLRAGQVVMLGSVTPPVWLDGPCRVEVTFAALAPAVVTFV